MKELMNSIEQKKAPKAEDINQKEPTEKENREAKYNKNNK